LAKSAGALAASQNANVCGVLAAVRKEATPKSSLSEAVARRERKGERRCAEWGGQQLGAEAHLFYRSHGTFLQNLAQAWPSGLRCQSFIATFSRPMSCGVHSC
jgi:hypothetical protein